MKAVNIVLLVLAGALSGALLMKVAQPSRRTAAQPMANMQIAQAKSVRVADAKPSPLAQQPPPSLPAPAAEPEPASEPPAPAPNAQPPAGHSSQPAASRSTASQPAAAQPAPSEPPAEPPVKLRAPHTQPHRVEIQSSPPAPHLSGTAARAGERSVSPPPRPTIAEAAPAAPHGGASSAPPAVTVTAPPASPEQPKETPPARMEQENATPASAPSAPQPNQATLNAGMLIPVRLLDSLSPERNRVGDPFEATLDSELVASGFVIAERGARVEGRVTAADGSAHTMSLELVSVHTSDNQEVAVQTERFDKRAAAADRSHAAEKIGGGAAIGAAIGAIAGGGKGAAIGAGAGGSIGAGDVLLSKRAGSLPSETRLVFRLRAPVTITEQVR